MQRVQGDAATGNVTVTTVGVVSTTLVEGSFPAATVTVFNQGTLNLSAIFSDNGITPKANPFTAAADGSWFFYAANARYDIQLAATGLARTISDVLLDDPANNQAFGGNVSITGTLGVTGASTFSSVHATGNEVIDGTLQVTGATTVTSLHATGNETVDGTLQVTGLSTLASAAITGAETIGTTLGVTGVTTLSDNLLLASGKLLKWNADAALSRLAAGTLALGTGAQGAVDGTLELNILQANQLRQISATTALSIVDQLGVSHFFIAGTSPFVNTFISGNGSGVVFLGTAAKFSVGDTTGAIGLYLGIATVGSGMCPIYAKIDLTAQNNNIGSTLIYNVPAAGAGLYAISIYIIVTTVAGVSSTLPAVNLQWTDADSSVAQNFGATATQGGNTTTTLTSLQFILRAKASTAINFTTTGYASNAANAMLYALHMAVEFLG